MQVYDVSISLPTGTSRRFTINFSVQVYDHLKFGTTGTCSTLVQETAKDSASKPFMSHFFILSQNFP
jgi:hypothetical protein